MGRGVLVWLAGCVVGCFPDPNPIEDTADTVETDTAVDDTADTADTLDTSDSATVADTRDTDVVVDTAVDTGLACSSDCSALGSACIEGYCDAGTCRTRAKPPDSPCNDGDACTVGDRCGDGADAGACVHDSVVTCTPIDDCHLAGECNAFSGVCSNPARDDGALCESAVGWDHSANDSGTCKSGLCQRLPMMALGREHSCALFGDGRLYCWGSNFLGQLGFPRGSFIGDDPRRSVASKGLVPAPRGTWLSAGDDVTCIVSTDGVRCWGDSDGFPTIEGVAPIDAPPLYLGVHNGVPVEVVSTSSASERVCAVTATGGVRCLGYEDDGTPFGYPGVLTVGAPPMTSIDEVGDIELVPTGAQFVAHTVVDIGITLCVLGVDHRAKCWGDSRFLGQALSENPYVGDDEAPSAIPFFTSTAHELVFRCFRDDYGRLACWGSNSFGELGLGDINPRVSPATVISEVVHVAAGGAFTCIVTELGDVKCWGANNFGQLGRGDTTPWGNTAARKAQTAARIQLPTRAARVYAGLNHACAVMRDGRIACWGRNNAGQLGINSTNDFGDEATETSPNSIAFPAE